MRTKGLGLSIEGENPNTYRCCFCCHVRTGTIFLGVFHLLAQILVLSLFALLVLSPEIAETQSSEIAAEFNNDLGFNFSFQNYQWFNNRKDWTSEDKFLSLLVTMGFFLITVMLIYGAIMHRPGYLMPFFCLQVFDFCVSCLTIVGYFSYMPDIKGWIAAQDQFPFKERLLCMDGDWLMLLAVLFFVLILSMKAYLIGVVWACYKYCTFYAANNNGIRRFTDGNVEDAEMLLPPKYEDAINMTYDQPPPPPYVQ